MPERPPPIQVPKGLEWVAAIGAALMGAFAGALTYWFLMTKVVAPLDEAI